MKKLQLFTFIFGFLITMTAHADDYEVDQATQLPEHSKLNDSSALLNAKVNELFNLAIADANKKGQCDGTGLNEKANARTALYSALKDRMGSSFLSNPIEKFVKNENRIFKKTTSVKKSIFAAVEDQPEIGIKPVILFGKTEFGMDKLTDFFQSGHSYFREVRTYPSSSNRKSRVEGWSLSIEQQGSGPILSWADHAARMSGYKFWDDVCGAPDEDMQKEAKLYFENTSCHANSYVTCEKGKWIRNPHRKTIDLATYINDSWDESVNCSQYRKEILNPMLTAIQKANAAAKIDSALPCPVAPKKCEVLFAERVPNLSPVCEKVGRALAAKKTLEFKPELYLNRFRNGGLIESPEEPLPTVLPGR